MRMGEQQRAEIVRCAIGSMGPRALSTEFPLLSELGLPVEGEPFAYCKGLRIRASGTIIEAIEPMRLPDAQQLVSN